jgi:tetratricopeptide (TPR) repeat protein
MIFARGRRLLLINLLLSGFVIFATALYMRGFSSPMYCDSVAHLLENSSIFARESILDVIRIAPQRPVAMLSFYADYLVGGMAPFHFRLVSAALLGVTSLAVFFVIILLLNVPALKMSASTSQKQIVALFCSVVFLVHPVQSQVVLYIWQRMTLLACGFYLLGLGAYLGTRLAMIKSKVVGFGACAILFLCAVLSKENAITLPVTIILAEVILFKQRLRTILALVATAALLVVTISIPLLFIERLPGSQEGGLFHMISLYYLISGLTPLEVALTQSRMLFEYLFLSLLPCWAGLPFWVAPIISRSLLHPPCTLLAVVGVLALMGLSLALVRSRPLTSFGILFFILNLVPESALIPTHLFCAYRVVLPLVGLLVAGADLALVGLKWAETSDMNGKVKIGLATMLVMWIAASVATAVSRATIWANPVLVWDEAVRNLPGPETDFDKMHYLMILDDLGYELQLKGRYSEAVPCHERSLKVFPTNMRSLALMATALAGSGDPEKAELYFKKALEAQATDARAIVFARTMYAEFLEGAGRKPEAVDQYVAGLKTQPDMILWHRKLGRLLIELGQPTEAVKCFGKALELEPHSADAHYDLATALQTDGKLDEAIRHYETALRLKPNHALAYNNLGRVMEAKGDVIAAFNCYSNALRYDNGLPEGHFNIGNALVALNNPGEAILHYRFAIAIRPDYAQAHNNLGIVLEELGDLKLAAEHYRRAVQLKPDAEILSKNLMRVSDKLRQQREQNVPH